VTSDTTSKLKHEVSDNWFRPDTGIDTHEDRNDETSLPHRIYPAPDVRQEVEVVDLRGSYKVGSFTSVSS
jgi:hypothetical protein